MVQIEATTWDAYKLMHDGALAFGRAERQGLRVDMEYCERKTAHLTRKVERLRGKLEDTKLYRQWRNVYGAKTNLDSNHQLAHLLYKVMKIKAPKTTTSGAQGSTDEETLKQLDVPGVDIILQIRKLYKMRDTYLDAFMREQVGGYMHPFFLLHTVRTFRSSSSNPNFQNIPKRDKESMQTCRRAILPRPGHQLLEVDFSGLEVMIAACYHKDPVMLRYLEDAASDMHGDMAAQIFMIDDFDRRQKEHNFLRSAAKTAFVFPQFYGDYFVNNALSLAYDWGGLPHGKWKPGQGVRLPDGRHLSDHLIGKGITEFGTIEKNQRTGRTKITGFLKHMQEIEDDFWGRRFKVYKQWREDWVAAYKKRGYIDMHTGFRCKGVMRKNEVINYAIQGAAFHCLLWCFIQIDRIAQEEGWDSRLVGQIHDAMVLDVNPDELEHVARTIQRVTCVELPQAWPWIIVPLEVEADLCPVDESWAAKQEYKLPEAA